jgi:hypothetical protein
LLFWGCSVSNSFLFRTASLALDLLLIDSAKAKENWLMLLFQSIMRETMKETYKRESTESTFMFFRRILFVYVLAFLLRVFKNGLLIKACWRPSYV